MWVNVFRNVLCAFFNVFFSSLSSRIFFKNEMVKQMVAKDHETSFFHETFFECFFLLLPFPRLEHQRGNIGTRSVIITFSSPLQLLLPPPPPHSYENFNTFYLQNETFWENIKQLRRSMKDNRKNYYILWAYKEMWRNIFIWRISFC